MDTVTVDPVRAAARHQSLRSLEERNALVVANLRLVGWVLRQRFQRKTPGCDDDDDLFQVGCIALMRAAELYDPEALGGHGRKFSSYAVPAIHRAMTAHLLHTDSLVAIPTHVLGEERQELVERLRPGRVSPWGYVLARDTANPAQETIDRDELRRKREWLRWALGRMPPDRRRVMELRLAGKTLVEVGQVMGLSRERIRQLESDARRRLLAEHAALPAGRVEEEGACWEK